MEQLLALIGLDGTAIINTAVSVFEKVVVQLKKGIELCQKNITEKEEVIAKATDERSKLEASITKAEKVIANIKKITE